MIHSMRSKLITLPPAGGLAARGVVLELLKHGGSARLPLGAGELHRAGADVFLDLLERIGLGDALGHDEAHGRADLAERQQHLRIRLRQHPLDGLVVDGDEFLLDALDHEAHGIAGGPACQARHNVFRQHGLAIVELETGAQLEGPGQAVGRNLLALDHLALRLQLAVHAVERVPDELRRVAHHILRAPDGIEVGKVCLRHEFENGGALRDGGGGEPAGRSNGSCSASTLENSSA